MADSMFYLYLLILFVSAFVTNGTLPFLPVTPFLLWLTYLAPTDTAQAMIVLAATLGNVTGWLLMEKTLLKKLSKRYDSKTLVDKALSGFPAFMHPFFQNRIYISILLFNALPFPADPFRVVASFKKLPRYRILGVICVGRLIRYSLLVMAGSLLARYKPVFWALFVLFLLMPVPMIFRWIKKRLSGKSGESELV